MVPNSPLATTSEKTGPACCVVAIFPAQIVVAVASPAFAAAAPLMAPYALASSALAGAIVVATYLIGIDRHGFAIPVAAIGTAEIVAIALVHPDLATVVRIVLIGHAAAFVCCLTEAVIASRHGTPRFAAPVPEA